MSTDEPTALETAPKCRHCGKPLEPSAKRCASCRFHQAWYGNLEGYLPLASLAVAFVAMLPNATKAVYDAVTVKRPELHAVNLRFDDQGMKVLAINQGTAIAVVSQGAICTENPARAVPLTFQFTGSSNTIIKAGDYADLDFSKTAMVLPRDTKRYYMGVLDLDQSGVPAWEKKFLWEIIQIGASSVYDADTKTEVFNPAGADKIRYSCTVPLVLAPEGSQDMEVSFTLSESEFAFEMAN